MIQFISIQLFTIYVLARQPQGQLQRQHWNIRKIQKYKQQKKSRIKDIIKNRT